MGNSSPTEHVERTDYSVETKDLYSIYVIAPYLIFKCINFSVKRIFSFCRFTHANHFALMRVARIHSQKSTALTATMFQLNVIGIALYTMPHYSAPSVCSRRYNIVIIKLHCSHIEKNGTQRSSIYRDNFGKAQFLGKQIKLQFNREETDVLLSLVCLTAPLPQII